MKLLLRVNLLLLLMLSVGCTTLGGRDVATLNKSEQYYNYIQPSFADYLQVTKQWLTHHRAYITADRDKELAMNMPVQLVPEGGSDKAILLVHGLGDSPYSFSDLAKTLHKQGFVVQTLLLPGHGSNPEHMKLPKYQDWQQIVDHYANLLKQQYANVWLGGYSTGGNLVTIHAIEQQGIDGLLLFAPGFQSRTPILEKFASFASWFTDGFVAEEKNLARYTSAPINGAIAYIDSSEKFRELIEDHKVTVPTLIAMSEADSIIDAEVVKQFYLERFNHPLNRFIWYGESQFDEAGIVSLTMKLPSRRISTGSHMSTVFAPDNPYYGVQGERRMCKNGFDDIVLNACKDGAELWFSAWGYREKNKVHARLTWNPVLHRFGGGHCCHYL